MANSGRVPAGEGRSWPERRVVRVDKSPMNPRIKIARLNCGHDVYRNRAPRIGAVVVCEKCSESQPADRETPHPLNGLDSATLQRDGETPHPRQKPPPTFYFESDDVVPPPVSHPPAAEMELARIKKLAKCLRLEDVIEHATERSEVIERLRKFEIAATLQIQLAALQQQVAALTAERDDACRAADCPMLQCPYEKRAEQAEQQVAALQREQERLLRELGTMGTATDNLTAPTDSE